MENPTDAGSKQNIKTQRVRSYFIQAAKTIILEEGVENVSVRKVADAAGYTFSTIYNYFASLNDLLQAVKDDMIQDLMIHMREQSPRKVLEIEDIKEQNRLYVGYFLKNPNVFSFFYSYRLHPVDKADVPPPDFSSQYLETYRSFVDRGLFTESEVPVLAKTFIYSLQGLLALYFSDNGMTEEILYEELDRVAEFLLQRRVNL